MDSILLDKIPFTITEAEILRAIHMDEEDEEAEMVREMIARFQQIAVPKAVYTVSAVEEHGEDQVVIDGVRVQSRLVAVNLEKVNRVVPYVATCGVEAEELSHEYTDIYESFCADAIKLALVRKASEYVVNEITQRYFGGAKLSRMSPGSLKEWPISAQTELFRMIPNVREKSGITLTESFLMLPHKSVSGILFQSDEGYVNCAMCPLIKCPNRAAPYDEGLYQRKYGVR